MKGRQVGFVLVALIAVGVIALVVRLVSAEAEQPTLTEVSALSADVVDKVVMRDNDNETVLTKAGNEWFTGVYPAVQERIDDMWETVTRIPGAGLIATNPDNHILMGVSEKNASVVQFWRDDELLEEFLVGDKQYAPVEGIEKLINPWSPYVRLCYIRRQDRDEVYGAFCPFPEPFGTNPEFWKDPVIVAIPPEEVEVVSYRYLDEAFDLKVVESVWIVESDGVQQQAFFDVAQDLVRELEMVVTDEFPTDEEVASLDFSKPFVTLGVGTRQGASASSVLLLLLRNQDNSYYVKNAEASHVYYLNPESAERILTTMEQFIP